MTYRKSQCRRAEALIEQRVVFDGDPGGGTYRGKVYPFALQTGYNNIYAPCREAIIRYFIDNDIVWWGGRKPTVHPLSSQIACLNHLFPIQNDEVAILDVAKRIDPRIAEILPVGTNHEGAPEYVRFEAISDVDHLNEGALTRGSNCTSLDALIYGRLEDGRRVLLPIEWKYTEVYGRDNKACGTKGATRKKRYTQLIDGSHQLASEDHAIYYFEPFYQLMRQTLWAEQMIAHKETESLAAEDFIHVHVIPPENRELLHRKYHCSGEGLEDTWRSCISDQGKYRIISPQGLLEPINRIKYKAVLDYLGKRYWEPMA